MLIIKKYEIEQSNGKTTLDYPTYSTICNIDPTTQNNQAGKYCNWLLQHITIQDLHNQQLIQQLHIALEQFHDANKRGILKQYGINTDIGTYKTINNLISTMQSLIQQNIQISQSEYNNRQKLQGQFTIKAESQNWYVVQPKTFEAERYFGAHSQWCTVGNISYFNSYTKKGPLYITIPKNGNNTLKMQFHFQSKSFADVNDNVCNNPKKCIFKTLKNDEESINELFTLWDKITPEFSKYSGVTFTQAMGLIKNGKPMKEVFDLVQPIQGKGNKCLITLNDMYNIIDINTRELSGEWSNNGGKIIKTLNIDKNGNPLKCKVLCEGNKAVDIEDMDKTLTPIGVLYPYLGGYIVLALDEYNKIWSNNTSETVLNHQIPWKGSGVSTAMESIKENGLDNTRQIVKATNGEDNAASVCLGYKKGGLQWYLPTIFELYMMYTYIDEINRIISGLDRMGYKVVPVSSKSGCWSSSEYNLWNAWYLWTDGGSIYSSRKDVSRLVRPVVSASALYNYKNIKNT